MNLYSLLCLLSLSMAISSEKVIWVSPTTHDFGDIKQKQPVTHEFIFKNTSGKPLKIDNVRPSCGCTDPEWPENSIEPDSSAAIHIEYDARDMGYFYKTIKVYFKGQRRAEWLFIEGNVIE